MGVGAERKFFDSGSRDSDSPRPKLIFFWNNIFFKQHRQNLSYGSDLKYKNFNFLIKSTPSWCKFTLNWLRKSDFFLISYSESDLRVSWESIDSPLTLGVGVNILFFWLRESESTFYFFRLRSRSQIFIFFPTSGVKNSDV